MTVQAWQLLSILLGIFLPTKLVADYLVLHLNRQLIKSPDSSVGRYAGYCLKLVEQATPHTRSFAASRHEIVSVFQVSFNQKKTNDNHD